MRRVITCQSRRFLARATHRHLPSLSVAFTTAYNGDHANGSTFNWRIPLLASALLSLPLLPALNEAVQDEEEVSPGAFRTDLPTYDFATVEKHTGAYNTSTWVVYKNGVYDITDFIKAHPGGTKILLAAGKSIEPFWQLYAAHHHADVYQILESLRIGNLREEDVAMLECLKRQRYGDGPYSNDPSDRHPALKVNSDAPFNAEPPPELLMQTFVTPNDLFFVRNHLPVPKVETEHDACEVVVEIDANTTTTLSIADLKTKFKHRTVTTTIQCAGNRRAEMAGVKQVNGLSWDTTALSTAEWKGVYLSDVLRYLGVSDDENESLMSEPKHVQFEGLDRDAEGNPYGASIPLETALDPRKEVLLAFSMNGEPIPRDHGYPLRVIVPGTVGARNVKFLDKIILAKEESQSFWQQKDYRGFPPNVDYSREDYWKFAGDSIQELPVQSAITTPKNGSVVHIDKLSNEEETYDVEVEGYAWSGGGRNIIRVDVSVDGGQTWTCAELSEQGKQQRYHRAWAWTPWTAVISVDRNIRDLDIRCKAVDASYNVQPDTIAPIWNMRGILNNAWHSAKIHIVETEDEEEDE